MIDRDIDGHRARLCSDCYGSGWVSLWDRGGELCDRCGGTGVLRAYPLVHVPLLDSHLFTSEYLYHVQVQARCFIEGWEACAYHATDMRQLTPHYADVRDWLLDYCDELIAMQVALHVTRPSECFFLQLPVLF